MEPNQHVAPWDQTGRTQYPAQPPLPGYYHNAPPMVAPMTAPPTRWINQSRPTWLGRWGLMCSILALVLPIMAAWSQSALLFLIAIVFAIIGVVFSSVGMSRRYTRRGLAIAGLVVGIVALAPMVLGVVVFAIGGVIY